MTTTINNQGNPTPAETKSTSIFDNLFSPLKPAESTQTVSSNQETPKPVNTNTAPSGNNGQVVSPAMEGLGHTKIPPFSTTGDPGVSGSTPLSGTPGGNNVSLGGIVAGEWAVNIMDSLLPAAIVAAFYAQGLKLRKTEIQLTEKEKGVLAPIVQRCLDSVLINFDNPWTCLAVTAGAIYGGKLIDKGTAAYIDKQEEEKIDKSIRDKIASAERSENPAKFDPSNQSAADIMSGKITYANGLPWSEEEIRAKTAAWKCNREKAIKRLKKEAGIKD